MTAVNDLTRTINKRCQTTVDAIADYKMAWVVETTLSLLSCGIGSICLSQRRIKPGLVGVSCFVLSWWLYRLGHNAYFKSVKAQEESMKVVTRHLHAFFGVHAQLPMRQDKSSSFVQQHAGKITSLLLSTLKFMTGVGNPILHNALCISIDALCKKQPQENREAILLLVAKEYRQAVVNALEKSYASYFDRASNLNWFTSGIAAPNLESIMTKDLQADLSKKVVRSLVAKGYIQTQDVPSLEKDLMPTLIKDITERLTDDFLLTNSFAESMPKE